jgi:Ca-activated chloride channel family protein
MTTPTLLITPRRAALLAGHDNELDVLVRVQAPQAPTERPTRHPLHLALVIDRSGSMSGQPLAEAKRCAEFVLDGLMPSDRLSVVAYDDEAETLIPAIELHDKDAVRRAIRQIHDRGCTNLHGGWLQGAETLAPHTHERLTSRVILLSDGCANRGITEPDPIYAQCADLARAGVTTSTYGLGRSFSEELMIGMARHGLGSSYYGQTAEDLMDPFREEFELLNALCARRLQLEVTPAAGVNAKMLNDYSAAGANAWLLPDLAFGGEAWAVVRLRVPSPALVKGPSESAPGADPIELASFSVRYTTLDGEPRAIQPQSLSLPALPASAFNAIAEDELVVRRAGELEVAHLQGAARAAARHGDWDAVGAALQKVERVAATNPWVAAALNELRALAARKDEVMFAKESAYSARRMSSRLAACREPDNVHDAAPGASYLRRKSNQGKADKRPSSS